MENLKIEGYEQTNYLVYVYVTHANSVVQDCISNNMKTKISRAKIEKDIIRLIHQNEDLPLDYKIACASMILHTSMFDSFWYGYKMSEQLSSRSIKRMKPGYGLVEEVPCPSDTSSSETTATATSTLLTPATSSNGGDSEGVASVEVTNGKKNTTSAKNNGPKKPPPKRKAPAKPKTNRATTTKQTKNTKAAAASSAPLLKSVAKPTGVVKNTAPTQGNPRILKGTNRPIGPTGKEVYEKMKALDTEKYHWGGPSSGSDSESDDDDSDSDEGKTGVNPNRN